MLGENNLNKIPFTKVYLWTMYIGDSKILKQQYSKSGVMAITGFAHSEQ